MQRKTLSHAGLVCVQIEKHLFSTQYCPLVAKILKLQVAYNDAMRIWLETEALKPFSHQGPLNWDKLNHGPPSEREKKNLIMH